MLQLVDCESYGTGTVHASIHLAISYLSKLPECAKAQLLLLLYLMFCLLFSLMLKKKYSTLCKGFGLTKTLTGLYSPIDNLGLT